MASVLVDVQCFWMISGEGADDDGLRSSLSCTGLTYLGRCSDLVGVNQNSAARAVTYELRKHDFPTHPASGCATARRRI